MTSYLEPLVLVTRIYCPCYNSALYTLKKKKKTTKQKPRYESCTRIRFLAITVKNGSWELCLVRWGGLAVRFVTRAATNSQ